MPKRSSRPLRILWLADCVRTARDEAQITAFVEATDPTKFALDLLVLGPGVDDRFKVELEKQGRSVYHAKALSQNDIGGFLRGRRKAKDGKYDLLHAHGSRASLWAARMGKRLAVPVVATLYDSRIDRSGSTDLKKEEERAIRSLRKWGSRVIALSGAQWDRYVHEGAFARSFLEVIYQGVEIREAPRPEEREASQIWLRRHAEFPPGGQIAVTVADLDDWESGVDVLLWSIPDIVKESPQTRFVIVGEGVHREELERRVRARGLNKLISWHASTDDLRQILIGSDLFIHPSLRDPFPVAALKAMAAGLPVVGTRVGGVPEIIGTAEVGRLVPRSDADALARAVVDLLRDPPRLGVMGRAAAERVAKMFTVSGWVEQVERLYREVIDDHRAGRTSRPRSYARLDVELLGLNGNGRTNGARRSAEAVSHSRS